MHSILLKAEVLNMAFLASRLLAQATPSTAAQDATVTPLGLPLGTWVAIIIGGGGSAVLSKSVYALLTSGVSVAEAYSANVPKRIAADLERDGVETLNLKEEVRFAQIVNEALKSAQEQIATLQTNMTGMQANGLKQAELITSMQQVMFQNSTQHKIEMTEVNGRLDMMSQQLATASAALTDSQTEAARWQKLYEDEHERAEQLKQERDEARALLEQEQVNNRLLQRQLIETGEHPAVRVPTDASPKDEPPSSSSIPGLPLN